MSLIILTISPGAPFRQRFFRRLKDFIRNRFFHYGGPQSVLDSLQRGFKELEIDYCLNPKAEEIDKDALVGVLKDIKALMWAIEAKKKGLVKGVIAGPNLVITPLDKGKILLDENIDLVLVPSGWVRSFYSSFQSGFEKKIRVWAAGVENKNDFQEILRNGCLVYKKNIDENLFNSVIKHLKSQNIEYEIIKYGRYKKEKYFELLKKVKFMVYLQESESQGLALQEAWLRNVPTFVWNRGYMQYNNYKWQDDKIAAPYLTDDCGMFFKDSNDFQEKLPIFLNNLIGCQSREYALKNFTDEISSSNYLKIINELNENYGK